MADRLSQDGWKDLGYVYVNIDDCWSSKERDEKGRLQPDPKRWELSVHGRPETMCSHAHTHTQLLLLLHPCVLWVNKL